jgi:hypothetical protein
MLRNQRTTTGHGSGRSKQSGCHDHSHTTEVKMWETLQNAGGLYILEKRLKRCRCKTCKSKLKAFIAKAKKQELN